MIEKWKYIFLTFSGGGEKIYHFTKVWPNINANQPNFVSKIYHKTKISVHWRQVKNAPDDKHKT